MPTYVYRCPQEHTFEVEHRIKDESPRHCPECGAAAKRVPAGGAGLLFKGSGFYITDYRSSSYQQKAKADAGGDKPASGGAGAPSTPPSAPSPPSPPKSGGEG